MMDNRQFIALVAEIVEKTVKAVGVTSKIEDQLREFVAAIHSTSVRSATSHNQPPTDISDQTTNKKACHDILKNLAP